MSLACASCASDLGQLRLRGLGGAARARGLRGGDLLVGGAEMCRTRRREIPCCTGTNRLGVRGAAAGRGREGRCSGAPSCSLILLTTFSNAADSRALALLVLSLPADVALAKRSILCIVLFASSAALLSPVSASASSAALLMRRTTSLDQRCSLRRASSRRVRRSRRAMWGRGSRGTRRFESFLIFCSFFWLNCASSSPARAAACQSVKRIGAARAVGAPGSKAMSSSSLSESMPWLATGCAALFFFRAPPRPRPEPPPPCATITVSMFSRRWCFGCSARARGGNRFEGRGCGGWWGGVLWGFRRAPA